jgi:hypothetical protein
MNTSIHQWVKIKLAYRLGIESVYPPLRSIKLCRHVILQVTQVFNNTLEFNFDFYQRCARAIHPFGFLLKNLTESSPQQFFASI